MLKKSIDFFFVELFKNSEAIPVYLLPVKSLVFKTYKNVNLLVFEVDF